jgi:tetratricopeptide (TPR) repeat protein
MKRLVIILFAIVAAIAANGQNYIQDGDRCYDNSDYDCAITNYNNAFKYASGKDKQIAEIKLTRAKWCSEHIKTANQAFNNKNYTVAKEEYQKVLDSNPNDSYAQSQIVKCAKAINPPKLRKATSSELTDIWNNKYGVNPERRQKLISAGIDPDDAQRRLNNGEGKPAAITLSVGIQNVSFIAIGGSRTINVTTNASNYQITYLPSWCRVGHKSSKMFTLNCDANTAVTSRSDWFKVTAGDKEIRINVTQSGQSNSSNSVAQQNGYSSNSNCFNCPKGGKRPVGITLGYSNKALYHLDKNLKVAELDGIVVGVRVEPLFKYGFGINTGIFYEFYSSPKQNDISKSVINVPLNLEYRFNFHRNFSMFFYGGASIDYVMEANLPYNFPGTDNEDLYSGFFDSERFVLFLEYGGGIRMGLLQLNVSTHHFLNVKDDFNYELSPGYTASISLMF